MRAYLFIATCLAYAATLSAGDVQPATYAPMIEAVAPAVVTVYVSKAAPQTRMPMMSPDDPFWQFFNGLQGRHPRPGPLPKQIGQGSGVIVAADGMILTNNHVVEDAETIEVQLRGASERITAKLVGTDPKTDVAVLRIEAKGRNLHPIVFADSDKVRPGDLVFAIGNPFGVGHSVSMGIVSATGRGDVGITDYEDFIQTDASINPGNSGGALVDSLGRLIGVNSAIYSRNGGNIGIGFAVPANLAKRVMDQLANGGKVVRGYLGVQISQLDAALARKFGIEDASGALVNEVVDDGPAAKAGVKAGDVVVKLDGVAIADPHQLRMRVSAIKPGAEAKLALVRDGKPQEMTVTVGEMPGGAVAAADHPANDDSGKLGVTLRDLDASLRRQFEIPARVQGAVIMEVAVGSRAERAGLQEGMVVTEVERRAVGDAGSAVQQLRLAKGEVLLRVWGEGGLRWVVVPE